MAIIPLRRQTRQESFARPRARSDCVCQNGNTSAWPVGDEGRSFEPHLHEHRRAEVLVGVPPVRWAGRAAARAQDALVHAVELLAVLDGLRDSNHSNKIHPAHTHTG